ncbi:MAG TPA: hypothetical protein DD471_00650 [Planctomycetes bacterium]|nr:hypothetical protein [Planctomycetota bacterium]
MFILYCKSILPPLEGQDNRLFYICSYRSKGGRRFFSWLKMRWVIGNRGDPLLASAHGLA